MERDFKGVWIPKEIWLDKRLNALEKVILAEVDSLDKGDDGCWASNQYIADFCQCSSTKVSTSISNLVKLGYLQIQSFDGRTRRLKSRLSNFERQTFKKSEADFQNLKETNTTTNPGTNTRNNMFTPPNIEDVKAYCQERKNNVDPERFIDFYSSKGWMIGKNHMKDWKAAVRTWERNKQPQTGPNGIRISEERTDLDDELDRIF